MHTHYHNLRINRDATLGEINDAFDRLLKEEDPRNHSVREQFEREYNIKVIKTAYRVLTNPVLRTRYDRWLTEKYNKNNIKEPTLYTENKFKEVEEPSISGLKVLGICCLVILISGGGKLTGKLIENQRSAEAVSAIEAVDEAEDVNSSPEADADEAEANLDENRELSPEEETFRARVTQKFVNRPIDFGKNIIVNNAYSQGYVVNFDLEIPESSNDYLWESFKAGFIAVLKEDKDVKHYCEEKIPVTWGYHVVFNDGFYDDEKFSSWEVCDQL